LRWSGGRKEREREREREREMGYSQRIWAEEKWHVWSRR
jgi:hypothetical protein